MPKLTISKAGYSSLDDVLSRLNQYGCWTSNIEKQVITAVVGWHTFVSVYVRNKEIEIEVSPRQSVSYVFGLLPILIVSNVFKHDKTLLFILIATLGPLGFFIGQCVWRFFLMRNTPEWVASVIATGRRSETSSDLDE